MGYLTLYARIQNLVKCEAPGAKITDYIVQRGHLGATVTVQAVGLGPGNIRTTINALLHTDGYRINQIIRKEK